MKAERFGWAAVLLFLAIAVSSPLFSTHHVISGVDMTFHLSRIEGIKEGLLSGEFPVRINPVQLNGYGMPTGIFYPDVFLYLPAILRMLGVPLLTSWKCFLVGINLITAFAGWWAFATFSRSLRIGAASSCLYLVSFYRLLKLYLAFDVSEVLAMAFLPAALAAVWVTLRRDASYWPMAVFFSVCVLLSHIITSIFLVVATALIVAASLSRFRHADVRQAVGKAVGFIFLLALWFYAPLWYFHHHMEYVMKAVTGQELWYWMIFPLSKLDFYIGSLMMVLLIGTLLWALHRQMHRKGFWPLIAGGIAVLFLVSTPQIWRMVGTAASFLQTPIRLMAFAVICLSLAVAIGLDAAGWLQRWRGLVMLFFVIAMGVTNYGWLAGHTYFPWQSRSTEGIAVVHRSTASDYLMHLDLGYGYNGAEDYMDAGVRKQIERAGGSLQEKLQDHDLHPSDSLEIIRRSGNDFLLHGMSGDDGWVQLPVFWYDGYAAWDVEKGEACPIKRNGDGQVSVYLPPFVGNVHVWYEGLPWFHVTDLASWFGLFWYLYASYRVWRRRMDES